MLILKEKTFMPLKNLRNFNEVSREDVTYDNIEIH